MSESFVELRARLSKASIEDLTEAIRKMTTPIARPSPYLMAHPTKFTGLRSILTNRWPYGTVLRHKSPLMNALIMWIDHGRVLLLAGWQHNDGGITTLDGPYDDWEPVE